jgi:hypothetical protein
MTFSHQTRGAMAQVLTTVSEDAARTFLYKHTGLLASQMPPIRSILRDASPEVLTSMLFELLGSNKVLRLAAPVKHVFESAVEDLARWALYDGWAVEKTTLVRVTPLAEEVTGVRDKLIEDLGTSGLDADGAVAVALEGSAKDFVSEPPDLNGSVTKVRIALETIARRGAAELAKKRKVGAPEDSWGKVLHFLRTQGVIEQPEEEILARVYTFTSSGAHVPKGITAEEWARLARTFAVSSAYFLLRKLLAA